jgi:hypothetical protein
MDNIYAWHAANPFYYYLIALTALFSFVTLAAWTRPRADGLRFEILFHTAAVLTLFAWRWPIYLAPFPINPDESTFAAGALKAHIDLAPWRGFNPGTSGPLNAYILAIPALFGAPITFASGRIIATCLLGAALFALYYAVKWTSGARVARLCLVPVVLLLSLATDWDFVSYSSEHVSICLTTIALAASAYLAKPEASISSRIAAGAVAGFCIGSTLFAKLQAVPLAFVVFIFAAAATVSLRGRSRKETGLVVSFMLGGLCVVPAAILISLWWTGEFHDAYLSYIQLNLGYVSTGLQKVRLGFFLEYSKVFTAFLICSAIIVFWGAIEVVRRRRLDLRAICVSVGSLLFVITALYIVYKPHREFPHYLLFLIFPLGFLVASALRIIRNAGFWKDRPTPLAILFVALFILPSLSVAMSSGNRFIAELAYNLKHRRSAVAIAISRFARPGDPMTVWGWASEYHVQTGAYPAARETETEGFIRGGPYNEYFRRRYLSDIKTSKPVVFVDAVCENGFYFKDRATQGHEIFPELAAFIQDNYVLKEEVSGVRIYVVKTR